MTEVEEIVRLAKKDINGHLEIKEALKRIKGVGANLGNSIAQIASEEMDINKETKIGSLNEEQLKELEKIIFNPHEHGLPSFMMNRRKDRETGQDKHLTEADLELQTKRDIDFMKSMKSYRGVRHIHGKRVRGQKTRTTGRGEQTLGVKKKKLKPAEKGK